MRSSHIENLSPIGLATLALRIRTEQSLKPVDPHLVTLELHMYTEKSLTAFDRRSVILVLRTRTE